MESKKTVGNLQYSFLARYLITAEQSRFLANPCLAPNVMRKATQN